MCLGGHLAFRCALDSRVSAAVCYFATDIHSATLGAGKSDDSLQRVKDIKGELVMIFGKMDNHVPPEGRDLIRKTLHEAGVTFSFYEPAWAQRKSVPYHSCRWHSVIGAWELGEMALRIKRWSERGIRGLRLWFIIRASANYAQMPSSATN
jgi:hypothetical protein